MSIRALFCIGINQNYFDAAPAEARAVWVAFDSMLKCVSGLPGVKILGSLEDLQSMVGAATGWPFSCYLLADLPDVATVEDVYALFRSTSVFGGPYKLWRYARIEARTGRELAVGRRAFVG